MSSKTSKLALAKKTLQQLDAFFPKASCTLDMDNPFRLCVRGIMSAQCTDVRVNIVADSLFEKYPTPEELASSSIESITTILMPCGLAKSKSRYVKQFATMYINEWNRVIPQDTKELMRCPGIGKKIANLIVGEVYQIPAIVVDTHCMRVSNRIGLSDGSTPLAVEKQLCMLIDKSEWISYGHKAIALGRSYCSSANPKCDGCPMKKFCEKNI